MNNKLRWTAKSWNGVDMTGVTGARGMALVLVTIVATFFFLTCGLLQASDLKSRMEERLPTIMALKAKGVIGESNQGFLEVVAGAREGGGEVTAENADRQQVYEEIARGQGTSAAVVGQRRALQLAERARPGEWLQDAGGRWYRK